MDKSSTAVEVLHQLLRDACDEAVFDAIVYEKQYRAVWGHAEPVAPNPQGELMRRALLVERAGVDIYGQQKPTETKYFTCTNCDRSVGGNRFAVHVTKCVTRGRRQRANY